MMVEIASAMMLEIASLRAELSKEAEQSKICLDSYAAENQRFSDEITRLRAALAEAEKAANLDQKLLETALTLSAERFEEIKRFRAELALEKKANDEAIAALDIARESAKMVTSAALAEHEALERAEAELRAENLRLTKDLAEAEEEIASKNEQIGKLSPRRSRLP